MKLKQLLDLLEKHHMKSLNMTGLFGSDQNAEVKKELLAKFRWGVSYQAEVAHIALSNIQNFSNELSEIIESEKEKMVSIEELKTIFKKSDDQTSLPNTPSFIDLAPFMPPLGRRQSSETSLLTPTSSGESEISESKAVLRNFDSPITPTLHSTTSVFLTLGIDPNAVSAVPICSLPSSLSQNSPLSPSQSSFPLSPLSPPERESAPGLTP